MGIRVITIKYPITHLPNISGMYMRFSSLLGAGLVLLATATQAFAGATLERVESRKEMVNVLMESYPPFCFLN